MGSRDFFQLCHDGTLASLVGVPAFQSEAFFSPLTEKNSIGISKDLKATISLAGAVSAIDLSGSISDERKCPS